MNSPGVDGAELVAGSASGVLGGGLEGERFLARLLSNLPGMAYRCLNDPDWTMVFVSEGSQALTGYGPADLEHNRALSYGSLIVPEDHQRVWEEVQVGLDQGKAYQLTYRIRTAAGEERCVWEQGRGILDDRGCLRFLEGFVTDVSDRVRAEEALRQSEDQLHRARQMEALGRLAGGVAHDFNNLLTAITGHSESLLHGLPADSPLRARATAILRAADQGAALAVRLLAGGRAPGRLMDRVRVHRLLREVKPLLEALAGPDVEVVLELAPGEVEIRGDRLQLEQVLMNLALNSRDAMAEGGSFRISTECVCLDDPHADLRPGRYLRLLVEDCGDGMDEDTLARVFEPFFTTKEVGRGSGLGLFSAYGIVQQHGGHIAVESHPGSGTKFTILLPVVNPRRIPVDEPAAVVGGTETVLLAEDEELLRELARESLARHGYRVLEAGDGESALEVARGYPGRIDLLVSDVVMPRMDGLQLAERLCSLRPGLRVLYITGYMRRSLGDQGEALGGALIEKPFRAETLLRRVRDILDGAAP